MPPLGVIIQDLPNEIGQIILTRAVVARGLKRAVSLRLVCRLWNTEVMYVCSTRTCCANLTLLRGRLISGRSISHIASCRGPDRLPVAFRLIRRVAEYDFAAFNRENPEEPEAAFQTLKQRVVRLCSLTSKLKECTYWFQEWVKVSSRKEADAHFDINKGERHRQTEAQIFHQALLRAAAAMNDVTATKALLPGAKDDIWLLCNSGREKNS